MDRIKEITKAASGRLAKYIPQYTRYGSCKSAVCDLSTLDVTIDIWYIILTYIRDMKTYISFHMVCKSFQKMVLGNLPCLALEPCCSSVSSVVFNILENTYKVALTNRLYDNERIDLLIYKPLNRYTIYDIENDKRETPLQLKVGSTFVRTSNKDDDSVKYKHKRIDLKFDNEYTTRNDMDIMSSGFCINTGDAEEGKLSNVLLRLYNLPKNLLKPLQQQFRGYQALYLSEKKVNATRYQGYRHKFYCEENVSYECPDPYGRCGHSLRALDVGVHTDSISIYDVLLPQPRPPPEQNRLQFVTFFKLVGNLGLQFDIGVMCKVSKCIKSLTIESDSLKYIKTNNMSVLPYFRNLYISGSSLEFVDLSNITHLSAPAFMILHVEKEKTSLSCDKHAMSSMGYNASCCDRVSTTCKLLMPSTVGILRLVNVSIDSHLVEVLKTTYVPILEIAFGDYITDTTKSGLYCEMMNSVSDLELKFPIARRQNVIIPTANTKIGKISLRGCNISGIKNLTNSFTCLRNLTVTHSSISTREMQILLAARRLEYLQAYGNPATGIEDAYFLNMGIAYESLVLDRHVVCKETTRMFSNVSEDNAISISTLDGRSFSVALDPHMILWLKLF